MRTLITWTLTLAVGASASGQGISPSTTKKAAPPAAPAARAPAAPIDTKVTPAKGEVDPVKAREEMERVLAEWEKRSKQVVSLDVLFDRIDRAPAWGDQYYQGRAMLQSPDLACLQFQKYKLDPKGKPMFTAGKDGKVNVPLLEPEPFERIVCTGNEVLQYSWDDHKIFVFPLDKQSKMKALQQGPLPFLFNMKAAEAKKRYTMTLRKQDDRDYLIAIAPNEQIDKDSFSTAFLWLSKETYLPNQLWLYTVGEKERQEFRFTGNYNTIKANTAMDKNFFVAKKIDGWKVIENPGADAKGKPNAAPAIGPPPRRAATQPAANPVARPRP